jgi:hypothetical protein
MRKNNPSPKAVKYCTKIKLSSSGSKTQSPMTSNPSTVKKKKGKRKIKTFYKDYKTQTKYKGV